MAVRKEQEIRLRKEVRDIIMSHMRETPFDIDNFVDDLMGAMNTEDNYRVKDFQDDIDTQRKSMQEQFIAEKNELRCIIKELTEERDKYKAKCSDTHKDSVIKELEHKLGRANEKISLLKRLAKVFMEEL
jgi:hypothetical protein